VTQQETGPDGERYSLDYEAHWRWLAERTAGKEAAFFLPHLREGMSLLDSGCGSGTITLGLAQRVGPGRVTGIDISEEQIEKARTAAIEQGIKNAEFKVADAHELPFEDETFDAVWSSGLLEHLREPERALKEMRRTLKTGGVIGLRGVDYGGFLFAPRGRIDHVKDLMARVIERDGGNMEIGREQPRLLREGGFTGSRFSASYLVLQPAILVSIVRGGLLSEDAVRFFEASGGPSRNVLEATVAETEEWSHHPDAFSLLSYCEAVAWKE